VHSGPSDRLAAWGVARYGDPCAECGYRWPARAEDALAFVADVPRLYGDLLAGHDAGRRHPDLGWSVGEYVCHVTDNLRIWAERLAGAALGGSAEIATYDSDLLAIARAYSGVPITAALWSLRHSVQAWSEAVRMALEVDVVLVHADRGSQRARDVACTNAHDAHHHAWDIGRILGQPGQARVTDR
jgi:DinB superfamily